MTSPDPKYYCKAFENDVKRFQRERAQQKDWEDQTFCVPSEQQRVNRLIRGGGVGKQP